MSLHIGLNHLSNEVWAQQKTLYGCLNDARAMRDVAASREFTPRTLLDEQATVVAVLDEIRSASSQLVDGDYFFLTYSGHGGYVPDKDGPKDEPDELDETWCLYDGQLIDDILYAAICRFAVGVRVLVLSDSCHSGTVTRGGVPRPKVNDQPPPPSNPITKSMPRELTIAEYDEHRTTYDQLDESWRPHPEPKANAKVILISGCMDDQESNDGDDYGAFTGAFLRIWNEGTFEGNFVELHGELVSALQGLGQTPGYFPYGLRYGDMQKQVPLSDTLSSNDL